MKKFMKWICLLVITISAMCLLSSCRPSEALTDAYYDSFFSQFFNQNDNDEQEPGIDEPDNEVPDNRDNDDNNRQHGNNGHRSNFWDSIFPSENNSEDWVAI